MQAVINYKAMGKNKIDIQYIKSNRERNVSKISACWLFWPKDLLQIETPRSNQESSRDMQALRNPTHAGVHRPSQQHPQVQQQRFFYGWAQPWFRKEVWQDPCVWGKLSFRARPFLRITISNNASMEWIPKTWCLHHLGTQTTLEPRSKKECLSKTGWRKTQPPQKLMIQIEW